MELCVCRPVSIYFGIPRTCTRAGGASVELVPSVVLAFGLPLPEIEMNGNEQVLQAVPNAASIKLTTKVDNVAGLVP